MFCCDCDHSNGVLFRRRELDTIGMITITAKHKSVMFRDTNNSRVTGWMFFVCRKTTMLIPLMKMVKNAMIAKIVALIHANHVGTESSVKSEVWLSNAVEFSIITDLRHRQSVENDGMMRLAVREQSLCLPNHREVKRSHATVICVLFQRD